MLKIGALEFDFPVVQAALAGYSDVAMRLLARRMGAPYALHEVVLDKLVVMPGKTRNKLVAPVHLEDRPLGAQLMGAEPAEFARAASILAESGYDVIDINFGCPVRKVLGRRRGGYLLSTPSIATEILHAVRSAVPADLPVTLKMRRGMDDSADSERDFFRIFDAALALNLDAITVHPRTVRQHYAGPSDWTFLKRAKQHAGNRTILGSGDLFSAQDIARMIDETGVDGVTAARGCIGNPWLFREARAVLAGEPLPDPPSVVEQGRVIREHFRLSVAAHGEPRAARLVRHVGIKYAELHPYARDVRAAFVAATDPERWFAVLDDWYNPSRDWPPGRRKTSPDEPVLAEPPE